MTDFMIWQLELLLRILLSALCGAAIGYERNKRGKGAGIRTHMVVALASALMMIVSKYGFSDISHILHGNIDCRLDPSRIASQIVTGVGFLGAGTIYFSRNSVKGLTTAAGIWATAGVGMAVGAGMYFLGIVSSIIIIIFQIVLHKNIGILEIVNDEQISIRIENTPEAIDFIKKILSQNNIIIESIEYTAVENNMIDITINAIVPKNFDVSVLLNYAKENNFIKRVSI